MHPIRSSLAVLILLVLFLASCSQVPPSGTLPKANLLSPGETIEITQKLPVNIVFVGFEQGSAQQDINLFSFKSGLASAYQSINRFPSYYGALEYTGNNFEYDYTIRFADKTFEDNFFSYLTSIAQPSEPTLFQIAYNCQYIPDPENPPCEEPAPNIATPVDSNVTLDATLAEKWLVQNAPDLGVDSSEYTVFFVNWYSREDFKFHVYTKTDEPDPDTGYNFGVERNSRKITAWGGSPEGVLGQVGRIWFMDVSAGPESSASSWNISDADVDGDGVTDYRIPPIWEYGSFKGSYRYANTLSVDLAKITRYVAVNLLFTPSFIYRVDITPPLLPTTLQLDINVYQGDPSINAKTFIKPQFLEERLKALQPLNTFSTEISKLPYTNEARKTYRCVATGNPCDPNSLISQFGGDLFLYNEGQLDKIFEKESSVNYEIPILAYSVVETPRAQAPALGFADDDWLTGTQSFVFSFLSQGIIDAGYGLSTTILHEVGHHIGLSHPHDGYDSGTNTDYGPGGDYYYAWLGDYSHSMMSYIDLSWSFGQFNRDAMNRALTTAYLNRAIYILDLAETQGKTILEATTDTANDKAREALVAYEVLNYPGAVALANEAYTGIVNGAKAANVTVDPFLWYEDYQPFLKAQGTTPILSIYNAVRGLEPTTLPSQGISSQGVTPSMRVEHYFPVTDGNPKVLEKKFQP
jgi:hypothetical protein